MTKHSHRFVEEYQDMVAFGFSREVDEKSLIYYLQKYSDDDLLQRLAPRLADEEITQLFDLMSHRPAQDHACLDGLSLDRYRHDQPGQQPEPHCHQRCEHLSRQRLLRRLKQDRRLCG